jgi:hypothetical protein
MLPPKAFCFLYYAALAALIPFLAPYCAVLGPNGSQIGKEFLLACGAQAFALSLIPAPRLVLPIQLLHGPAFSAMWAASVAYASENTKQGLNFSRKSCIPFTRG